MLKLRGTRPPIAIIKRLTAVSLMILVGLLAATPTTKLRGDNPPQFLFSIRVGQPDLPTLTGVAVDGHGNIYVSLRSDQLVKLSPVGGEIWRIGTHGSNDGQFDAPDDVAVDAEGNAYVVDYYNARIQKFDSSGNFLLKFGGPGSDDGQFGGFLAGGPDGVAVDSAGHVYVADTPNNRIQKFDSGGNFLGKFGSRCIVFTGGGYSGGCIDPDGPGPLESGDGQFDVPVDVAFDGLGNIYVADYGNARIQKFDSGGNFLLKFGGPGSDDGQFDGPNGIAVDSAGHVYVADDSNDRIQKFSPMGAFILQFCRLGPDDEPIDGLCDFPLSVAVDGAEKIYVADHDNRIQVFGSGNLPVVNPGRAVIFIGGIASESINRPDSGKCEGIGFLDSNRPPNWLRGAHLEQEGWLNSQVTIADFFYFSYSGFYCLDGVVSSGTGEDGEIPDYNAFDTCVTLTKQAERLAQLIRGITENTLNTKVTILAHSMGGLISTYLVASDKNIRERIASIVTFDSPLRGLPEPRLSVREFIGPCDRNDPTLAGALKDMEINSPVVKTVVMADSRLWSETVPLYAWNSTDPDFAGLEAVPKERTSLDGARSGFLTQPAPLDWKDNHGTVWNCRFERPAGWTSDSCPGDGQDKAELIGCALIQSHSCTFLRQVIAQSQMVQLTALVPDGSPHSRKFIHWIGSTIRLTLVTPSGVRIDPSNLPLGASHTSGSNFEGYEFTNPEPGNWTLELFGEDIPPEGEEFTVFLDIAGSPNFTPLADAGGPYAGNEGAAITINAGGSTDPDAGDVLTYSFDCTDDGVFEAVDQPGSTFDCAYPTAGSFTVRVRVKDAGGLTDEDTALVTVTAVVPADTTAPSCALTATTKGPPAKIEVTAQDTGSGIAAIIALKAINVTMSIPAFAPGITSPVVVTATKVNQSQSATVQLEVKDVAGNKTVCDPVITLVIREEGKPVTQTFAGLPQAESKVKIVNGEPGLTKLNITVNGKKFKERDLQNNEAYTLDVSSAMAPGNNNTITLEARGKPGGSALIVISD